MHAWTTITVFVIIVMRYIHVNDMMGRKYHDFTF